jgi:hypothetical protein
VGDPDVPLKEAKEQLAWVRRLGKLFERVKALEEKLRRFVLRIVGEGLSREESRIAEEGIYIMAQERSCRNKDPLPFVRAVPVTSTYPPFLSNGLKT